MKIFFDTNVLIAALVSRGLCNELFEYCLEEHTIYISPQVLKELETTLVDKFDFPKHKVTATLSFIQFNTSLITEISCSFKVCRDPDDDHILAAAVSGKVDCIISGDEDLTILETFKGIPIVTPSRFWKFEKEIANDVNQ
jgi:uncharacterized protein